ncbi:Putative superoxide dismutase-like, copper/zinc binding domain superfamily [Colletotrichum destructivum]|uniref:Superoxide dismutase-like, copper/zinc binding domain superfamily n=1 Tax=Colletotrichum destructivum TaxID=34406 RepID=A0AAX4J4K2_9PEZI|nr:Putative superoxide dismutase-like, copper/zinc binding domain superfamily [Colletotrichum destructivum]
MQISCVIAATVAAFVGAQSQATGELGDALVVANPQGVVYEAKLPEMPFFNQGSLNGNVRGSIVAMTAPDGNGVKFTVGFSNLPSEGGPFKDGNCTKALAHHDPFNRGETTPCDASKPETCQIGDLSGKHGSVTRDYEQTYIDRYLSLVQGPGSFFGNRSFVFHFANKTRISCANFKLVQRPAPYDNGTGACNTVRATNALATATPHSEAPYYSAASVMSASFYVLGAASILAFVGGVGDV